VVEEETEGLGELLYDVNEPPSVSSKIVGYNHRHRSSSQQQQQQVNNNTVQGQQHRRNKGVQFSAGGGVINEKTLIPKLNEVMLGIMCPDEVMRRLTSILIACSHPTDPNSYKTGFWGRAQVIHYAMGLLLTWASSSPSVRPSLYSSPGFSLWVSALVLDDPEPLVRRECCMGLYRLACLGGSAKVGGN
jgi:hypothetical protein